MLHKIFVNILSFFSISNIVAIPLVFPIMSDMYASYGMTDQIPNSLIYLYNFRILFWVLIIFIVLFTLWYDIYFNKKRREEKKNAYKKASIIAYVSLPIVFIVTFFIFIFWVLKPIMEIYMASFLFEANGI